MRSKTLSAAAALLAVSALLTAAAPAFAVSIKHTNRAEGDPAAAVAPTGHAQPPADTTEAHALDKAHESGALR